MQLQELNVCVRRKKHNQPLVKPGVIPGVTFESSIAYKLNLNTEIYGALFWEKKVGVFKLKNLTLKDKHHHPPL